METARGATSTATATTSLTGASPRRGTSTPTRTTGLCPTDSSASTAAGPTQPGATPSSRPGAGRGGGAPPDRRARTRGGGRRRRRTRGGAVAGSPDAPVARLVLPRALTPRLSSRPLLPGGVGVGPGARRCVAVRGGEVRAAGNRAARAAGNLYRPGGRPPARERSKDASFRGDRPPPRGAARRGGSRPRAARGAPRPSCSDSPAPLPTLRRALLARTRTRPPTPNVRVTRPGPSSRSGAGARTAAAGPGTRGACAPETGEPESKGRMSSPQAC